MFKTRTSLSKRTKAKIIIHKIIQCKVFFVLKYNHGTECSDIIFIDVQQKLKNAEKTTHALSPNKKIYDTEKCGLFLLLQMAIENNLHKF